MKTRKTRHRSREGSRRASAGLLHPWEGHHQCQIVHFGTHHCGGTPLSAQISGFPHSSKPFKNGGAQKFLHRRHARAPRARDTPVATRMTKTERRPPVIEAVPSSSIHPPPTLARGQPRKAVLSLLVRSRRLHGHAPWPRSSARRRLWRPRLRDDLRVLRLDHRVLCLFHLPWPWEQWERPP